MAISTVLNRPLGRTEHIYWLLDQLYCLNFAVFAELEGSLNEDELQLALETVQQENPGLRTNIVVNRKGQPCFKAISAGERPLTLEVRALRNWRQAVEVQLMTPFNQVETPLARFLWFRGQGKKSVIAMIFHHSIADGKSGSRVMFDILRRATGEQIKFRSKPAHPSAQQLDLRQDRWFIARKYRELKFWLDRGKDALKFAVQLPEYDMEVRPEREIKILPVSLSQETTTALRTVCREQDTTIHGVLGAALLFAVNKEFDKVRSRYLGLNSLADLRSVLKGELSEEDLGLYIATLTTVHSLTKSPDFWGLAKEIPSQLQEIMGSGDANLINSIHTEMSLFKSDRNGAEKVQKIVALAPPSSMLTNIGRVEPVDLGADLRITSLAFSVSPPAHHPFCVTVNSYSGKMYINLAYDQCKFDDDRPRRVADNMLDQLQQVASAG